MADFNSVATKMFRTKKIGDSEFQITVLPALEVIRQGKTLLNIVLPVFGSAFDALSDSGDEYQINTTFSDLSLLVCEQLDKLDVEQLITILFKGALKDGKPYDVNNLSADDVGEIFSVLEWALEENFHDFFMKNPLTARFRDQLTGLMGTMSNASNES